MIFQSQSSRFIRDTTGATAIEYGLIASLIALTIIAAAGSLGTKLNVTFNHIASNLAGPGAPRR